MGFIRANTIPILKEHKRLPFSGSLLCLGMPDVYFDYQKLVAMANTVDVDLDCSVSIKKSHNRHFASLDYISGDTLFRSIGFKDISVLDHNDYEGADIIFDLNSKDTPEEVNEKFDVIIDHGTFEHIFHIPNALSNCFRMLAIGGRMIHSSPTSNLVDHGFYMFSPTFFYDYYTANNWIINNIYVIYMQTPQDQEHDPFFYTEYEPGNFDHLSYGGLSQGMYFTLCFVTKTDISTEHVIPQQGLYKNRVWEREKNTISKTLRKVKNVLGNKGK